MSATPSDLGPYRGSNVRSVAVAFIIVSGIILILRFWSRALLLNKKFAADDWAALIAWPFAAATGIIAYKWSAAAGLGHHTADLPPSWVVYGLKLLFACEISYNITITLCRISITLLYRRIFNSNKYFRRAVWVTLSLNIAWFVTVIPIAIWQCNPPNALWGAQKNNYTCLPTLFNQLFCGITSIFLDLLLLILPLPVLWKLHIKPLRKALLILIFLLGYCVIFVTIGRLIFIVRLGASLNTDLSWSFAILIYWYMCEMLVASTCISLPTIFHFVLRGVRHGFRSLFTDREYSQDLPQWTDSDSRTLRNHSHNPSDGFVRLPPKASTGLFRKSGSIGLKQFNGVEAEEI